MATIEPYQTKAGKRWRVRYRKPDRSQTDKRGFKTKRDAQLFAATVETSKATGTYIDPTAGRVTIGELGPAWLSRQGHLKESTKRRNEIAWRVQVAPTFATTPVHSLRRSHVTAWVAELTAKKSATVVRTAYGVLRGIINDAVADGLIHASPIDGIPMPRKQPKRQIFLTHEDVDRLAEHSAYPLVVRLLAYTGLRWGEMAGLQVHDINFLRNRLRIERSITRVGSRMVTGTVKTHEARTVPVPAFLMDDLKAHVEGMEPGQLVFTHAGKPLAGSNATHRDGWLTTACKRAGIPRITPHDLRHTAASLAVQSGANVKVIQRMLGHKSAAVTLDIYSALFDGDLDDVATALDTARSEALG